MMEADREEETEEESLRFAVPPCGPSSCRRAAATNGESSLVQGGGGEASGSASFVVFSAARSSRSSCCCSSRLFFTEAEMEGGTRLRLLLLLLGLAVRASFFLPRPSSYSVFFLMSAALPRLAPPSVRGFLFFLLGVVAVWPRSAQSSSPAGKPSERERGRRHGGGGTDAAEKREEGGREGGEGWGRCGGNGETGRRRSSLPALPTCSPSSPVRSRGREEGREEVCLNSGESGSRRGGSYM